MAEPNSTLPIRFHFAPVSPELASNLVIYWEVETTVPGPIEDLMHPDWANIRFQLSGNWHHGPTRATLAPVENFATLTGTTDRGYWARGENGSGFCIMLYPLAWSRLLGADASHYLNKIVPLADVLGDAANTLSAAIRSAKTFGERVAISNAFFLKRLRESGAHARDAEILAIFMAVSNPDCTTVEDLTERTGIAQARLARLCKRTFGLAPKMILRRERFLRMLRTMEVRSYKEWQLFLDPQYVDQSHMIRDFKRFIGYPPSHYFALERPMLESSIEALKRLWAEGWDPLLSGPEALEHGG
jgi:AraC-like DNA-binding protein